jgi:hypothetical protein
MFWEASQPLLEQREFLRNLQFAMEYAIRPPLPSPLPSGEGDLFRPKAQILALFDAKNIVSLIWRSTVSSLISWSFTNTVYQPLARMNQKKQ